MNRSASIALGLLILVAVPLFFSLAGLGDGVPSRARFERVVTDPGLRESVAVVIRDERKLFEEMLQDSGYLDYGRHNERQKDAAVFAVTDALGRSYELTRAHVNYLRLIVFGSSFGDETKTIDAIRAMKPQRLDFNPHWFLYGGAYIYPCAASIGAFLLPSLVTGELSLSSLGDITAFIRNADLLKRIFLGMKFVNALAFVLSTVMVYLLARRLVQDSHGTGLFAALLFATTPVFTYFTHVGKPYVLSQAYVLASFVFFVDWLKKGRRRDFHLAAVFWGLSVGANYFFVGYLLSFALFYLFLGRDRLSGRAGLANDLRNFGLFAVVSAAAFFVANPYWLVEHKEVFHEVFMQSAPRRMEHSNLVNFLYFYARPLFTIGIPATVLSYVFILAGLRRRSLLSVTALVTMLFFGFALSSIWNMKPMAFLSVNDQGASEHYDGFGVHVWLLLLIVEFLVVRFANRRLAVALGALVVLSNAWFSAHTLSIIAAHEERFTEAGEWIDANVPAGATIMPAVLMEERMDEDGYRNLRPRVLLPYFDFFRYKVVYTLQKAEEFRSFPEYLVCRSVFLESLPGFNDTYRRVYASWPSRPPFDRVFYRYTMDRDPIVVYRRSEGIQGSREQGSGNRDQGIGIQGIGIRE